MQTVKPSVSKGELVNRILNRNDEIKNEMKILFAKNGVNYLNASALYLKSEQDGERWYKLANRSRRMSNWVSYLVLGK